MGRPVKIFERLKNWELVWAIENLLNLGADLERSSYGTRSFYDR
jgi:hypothetical protein|tara:strand:- start:186 stop:317 length:132 start_codon:yes stop_codon:yes gene_type:complete